MLYTDAKKRTTQTYNEKYDETVQLMLLTMLLSDSAAFALCRTILQEAYFDDRLRPAIRYIIDYTGQYQHLPAAEMVRAVTGVAVAKFSETGSHTKFLLETVEAFCQYKAMELTVFDSIELLQTGRAGEIVERAKTALAVGLSSALGTDYFADPGERLRRMLDHDAYVSTGWTALDDKLFGGIIRGELNIFVGGSGSGKSLFLQNLAINWSMAGHVVLYISLELSEEQVALRFDAMISGRGTRAVIKDIDGTVMLIRHAERQRHPGPLYVRRLPEAGTTANTLRAYIKDFQIKTGRKPDALIVDYLDLLYPNDSRIDPSNVSNKDKHVSEELRALLHETNTFSATASQLNRGAVAASDYDHSHIAGGLTKIMTADNVLGIYSTLAMKEKGLYKLQFLKARSSSSLGHTIELAYDTTSMRISDKTDAAVDVDKPLRADQLKQEMKTLDPDAGPARHGGTTADDGYLSRLRAKPGAAEPPPEAGG